MRGCVVPLIRWGAALCGLAVVSANASAQPGDGLAYRSRDPIACPPPAEQTRGMLSADQATRIFRCTTEIAAEQIALTENVRVQLGPPRPAEFGDGYDDLDAGARVYPITGSWTEYRCFRVIGDGKPGGGNCLVFDRSDGSGICYWTTLRDWRCKMVAAHSTQRPGSVPAPR